MTISQSDLSASFTAALSELDDETVVKTVIDQLNQLAEALESRPGLRQRISLEQLQAFIEARKSVNRQLPPQTWLAPGVRPRK